MAYSHSPEDRGSGYYGGIKGVLDFSLCDLDSDDSEDEEPEKALPRKRLPVAAKSYAMGRPLQRKSSDVPTPRIHDAWPIRPLASSVDEIAPSNPEGSTSNKGWTPLQSPGRKPRAKASGVPAEPPRRPSKGLDDFLLSDDEQEDGDETEPNGLGPNQRAKVRTRSEARATARARGGKESEGDRDSGRAHDHRNRGQVYQEEEEEEASFAAARSPSAPSKCGGGGGGGGDGRKTSANGRDGGIPQRRDATPQETTPKVRGGSHRHTPRSDNAVGGVATSRDLLGNIEAQKGFEAWISCRKAGSREVPMSALVIGPTGCGKTTFVTTLLREAGYNPVSVGLTSCKADETLGDHIDRLARSRPMLGHPPPAVVVDDFDSLVEVHREWAKGRVGQPPRAAEALSRGSRTKGSRGGTSKPASASKGNSGGGQSGGTEPEGPRVSVPRIVSGDLVKTVSRLPASANPVVFVCTSQRPPEVRALFQSQHRHNQQRRARSEASGDPSRVPSGSAKAERAASALRPPFSQYATETAAGPPAALRIVMQPPTVKQLEDLAKRVARREGAGCLTDSRLVRTMAECANGDIRSLLHSLEMQGLSERATRRAEKVVGASTAPSSLALTTLPGGGHPSPDGLSRGTGRLEADMRFERGRQRAAPTGDMFSATEAMLCGRVHSGRGSVLPPLLLPQSLSLLSRSRQHGTDHDLQRRPSSSAVAVAIDPQPQSARSPCRPVSCATAVGGRPPAGGAAVAAHAAHAAFNPTYPVPSTAVHAFAHASASTNARWRRTNTIRRAEAIFGSMDRSLAADMLHHNYAQLFRAADDNAGDTRCHDRSRYGPSPSGYLTLEALSAAADCFSRSDCLSSWPSVNPASVALEAYGAHRHAEALRERRGVDPRRAIISNRDITFPQFPEGKLRRLRKDREASLSRIRSGFGLGDSVYVASARPCLAAWIAAEAKKVGPDSACIRLVAMGITREDIAYLFRGSLLVPRLGRDGLSARRYGTAADPPAAAAYGSLTGEVYAAVVRCMATCYRPKRLSRVEASRMQASEVPQRGATEEGSPYRSPPRETACAEGTAATAQGLPHRASGLARAKVTRKVRRACGALRGKADAAPVDAAPETLESRKRKRCPSEGGARTKGGHGTDVPSAGGAGCRKRRKG